MRKTTKILPKEELEKLYHIEKKPVKDIATHFAVSEKIIYSNIRRFKIKRRGYNRCLDLKDKKIGKLTVKERSHQVNQTWYWKCECECGTTTYVRGSALQANKSQSCGCNSKKSGKNNPLWSGFEDMSGMYWSTIKNRAEKYGHEFTITQEYAWNLYLEQNKKCKLSGLEIEFGYRPNNQRPTASLDRIDSSKGYIKGNVQWTHKTINKMKWDLQDKEFIEYCKLVAEYRSNECAL